LIFKSFKNSYSPNIFSRSTRGTFRSLFVAFLIWLIGGWPTIAFALPQDGQIVSGDGAISTPTDTSMQVDQNTSQMIINWDSFNIGSSESVNFTQPSSSAIALNRVIGADPSRLLGNLTANGQVFITNGSGVFFGPGSRVDTHGLIATTMKISDQDFLDRNYNFSQDMDKPLTAVVNEGTISATAYVGLLSPAVVNGGTIVVASLGSVDLTAGTAATLDFTGDGLINFAVTEAVSGTVTDVDGNVLKDRVSNTGLIQANGGQVRMTAQDAGDAIRNVVNMEGVIEAYTVAEEDGWVILGGGDSGIVSVTGTITASGDDAGEKGGTVHVLGEKVGLFDNAVVNVSGDVGGGTALIGGDYQGKNGEIQNAFRTYVGEDAVIDASAGTDGDAGKVIVWADDVTRFYGSVFATGGLQSGDGGFIEISGKNSLVFQGWVDASSIYGAAGTVLFDPKNITISNGGSATLSTNDEFGENSSNSVTFDADQITAITNTGTDIILQANNDITIGEDIITNNTGGDGGDITLKAGRSVLINFNITTDNGALTITANETFANGVVSDRDTGNAVITMGASTTLNTGTGNVNIELSGGAGKTNLGSADINLEAVTTTGTVTIANNGTTVGSDIFLNGTFSSGSSSTTITTVSGTIVMNGLFAAGSLNLDANGQPSDIQVNNTLSITTGDVTLTADDSIIFNGSGKIDATGAGNVSVESNTDNLSGGSGDSIAMGGGDEIDAGSGTITLTSTGANAGNINVGILNTTNSTSSAVTITGAAGLTLIGTINTNGGGFVQTSGATSVSLQGNSLITSGGDITFNDAITLTAGAGLFTGSGGGDITIASTIDGATAFELSAGTGTILISGNVGASTGLTVLKITDSNTTTFSGTVNATTLNLADTSGAITFNGAVTATTLTTAAQGYSVLFNNGGTITNDTTFLNTGGVTFGDNTADTITFTGGLDTTAGTTTAIGTINTTNTQMDIGALTLTGNTSFDSGTAAASIMNIGAVTGAGFNLSLDSGTNTAANLTVTSISNVNDLTLVAGGNITQGGAFDVNGTSNFTVTGANTMTLNNSSNDFTGAITLASGTGAVQLTDSTATTITSATSTSGALTVITNNGNMTLADNAISVGSGNVALTSTLGSITEASSNTTANITTTGTISLTAGTSIGASGTNNELDIASATDLTFNVNDDLFVRGGSQTISALDVTVDPSGAATYTLANFNAAQTFSMTTDGTDLTVTDVSNSGAVNQTITAKTGNVTVTNFDSAGANVTLIASTGNITLEDNAINAGTGKVVLTSTLGSITEVSSNTTANITNTGTVNLNAGTSIGTSGTNNELDIASATNLTFDVNDSFFVRGGAQTIDGLTLTVDPSGAATYTLANFNAAQTFNMTTDGTDLTITDVSNTGAANQTITAKTGNINVTNMDCVCTVVSLIATAGNLVIGSGGINFSRNNIVSLDASGTITGDGLTSVTISQGDKRFKTGTASIGTLNFSGGTLTVDGALTVTSVFSWTGTGTVAGSGSLTNSGAMTYNASSGSTIALTFNNTGSLTHTATNTLTISGSGADTGDYGISNASGIIDFSGGTRTFASTTNFAGAGDYTFSGGTITLNSATVTSTGDFVASGAAVTLNSVTIDTTGLVNFSGGSVTTSNTDLSISASDLGIGVALDAGSGDVTITVSDAGTISVGLVGTGMSISTTELSNITANNLTIGDNTNDTMTIRGVSAADTDLITGTITFNATATGKLISIDTTASVFDKSVTFNANAGIAVAVDVTSDKGNLIFEGDSDNATSGAITINAGVTVTSTLGSITMDATTGGVTTAGVTTFNAANGITINDSFTSTGTGTITIDADTDNNGTGDFTLASGAAMNFSSNNNFLSVTANDLDIQGTINTGTATTTLLVSDGGTIGLGSTSGGMTISGTELQNITAANVDIGNSTAGNITVNNITLANTANISATLSMTTGGDLAFDTGASSITNKLAISAGGDITQNVALFTGGTFNFTVTGTNVVTLNNASNDFTGDITANSGTGAVQFSETTGTTFLASTLGGDLTVVTTSSIATSGIMTVGGDASFTTSSGDLSLNTSGNDLGAKLTLSTPDNIFIDTASTLTDLDITLSTDGSNTYTIDAANISTINFLTDGTTNVNFGTLTATALNFSLSNTTGGVTTSGAMNVGTGSFSLTTNDSSRSITISNAITAGALNLDSNGTDSDVIINAAVAITTGAVAITADDSITFGSGGSITATGVGDVSLKSATDALTGNTGDAINMTVGSTIDAGTGDISLDSSGTDGGDITIGQLTTVDLAIAAGGAITQGATITATGTSSFTVTDASDITLTTATNDFGGAVTLSSGKGSTVQITDDTAFILAASTLGGALTVNADDGITISGNVTTGSSTILKANIDLDATGTFEVDDGVTLSTTNSSLFVAAIEFDLNSTGKLNSGSNNTQIASVGTIGLGNANCSSSCQMTISGAELANITATDLLIGGTVTTSIFVDGVTEANFTNISGDMDLKAKATTTTGLITFTGTASTFKNLDAESNNGIVIETNLTSTTGELEFFADADGGGGSSFTITSGVTLTSAGAMELAVKTATISAAGSLNLSAVKGITFDSSLTSSGALTINADSDGDGTGILTVVDSKSINSSGNAITSTFQTISLGSGSTINAGVGALTNNFTQGFLSTNETAVAKFTGGSLTTNVDGDITMNAFAASTTSNIAGRITLNSTSGSITVVGAGTFNNGATLKATGDIKVQANLTINGGDFIAVADNDNNESGKFTVDSGVTITASAGDIDITGFGIDEGGTLDASGSISLTDNSAAQQAEVDQASDAAFLADFTAPADSGC
jgi:trimeric autotransporter adhesin